MNNILAPTTISNSHFNVWIEPDQWDTITLGKSVYRGMSSQDHMRDVYLSSPENRVPVNMPLNAQQEMDDCFENSFGVRFRQQSLFCTGSFEVAKSYAGDFGEVRVIRPESRFCFCWGVHSDDLYFEYCKMKDFERIPDFIERLIFKTDDLHHAIQSGNEIMLSGSRFRASKA